MNFRYLRIVIASIFAIVSCSFLSCKSDKEELGFRETVVNVSLAGVEYDNDDMAVDSKESDKVASSIKPNSNTTTVIPFDEHYKIVATLTKEYSQKTNLTSAVVLKDSGNVDNRAESTAVKTNLAPNTLYKILVYNDQGNLVAQKDYSYGNEATTGGFALDGGETYTFIAYSINSTTALPVVSGNTLSTAVLSSVSGDLMYFQSVMTLVTGSNNLSVILKHMFSQITTKIALDATSMGEITAISNPFMRPTHTSGTLKLSDGSITYNNLVTAGAAVNFGTVNGRSVTSTSTQLITPAVTNGSFSLGSITMNGLVKNAVTIPNLRVNPGSKYNLNLTFQGPCNVNVNGTGSNFNSSNGTAVTITTVGSDYGFLFDVFNLDNSFRLNVNGTNISTAELQFEVGNSLARNIQFADGSLWGVSPIPAIYNIIGTASNPSIRVYISRSGKVSLYGSKVSGGPLFPLVLTNGVTLNNVTWNVNSTNIIRVFQTVVGPTSIRGTGFGKRVVPCS